MLRWCVGLIAVVTLACSSPPPAATPAALQRPDSTLLGEFRDDYGDAFTISPALWTQLPRSRYHIVLWNSAKQYLIAQNDSANTSAPGRWTRIDWVTLSDMAPYGWAFCLSAYDAPTRAAAEAAIVANRSTPKTGCNGYPFSRMRRPAPGDSTGASPY